MKKGQVLVEFDLEAIKKVGYDSTTMMIFTNLTPDVPLKIFNNKDQDYTNFMKHSENSGGVIA